MKKYEFLAALLLTALLFAAQVRLNHEALAAQIAPSVLRLHILADSNRPEDQQIKLEVRSLILELLKDMLPDTISKAEMMDWLKKHQHILTSRTNELLHNHGFSYRSEFSLTRDYFPDRIYDTWSFPCGYYDAVRITLGSGDGHNWWCVLYPRLCLTEDICPTPSSAKSAEKRTDRDDPASAKDLHPDLYLLSLYSRFRSRLFSGAETLSTQSP